MKFTVIDEKYYEIRACSECPFAIGDGFPEYCYYPGSDGVWLDVDSSNKEVDPECPLREVGE